MAASTPHAVTRLLLAWSQGEQAALEKLAPLVYAELRRIAHRYMNRERRGHTLQTTELVNEAYLRLMGCKPGALARPRPLLRDLRSVDAANPGGFRPLAKLPQAWRRSQKDDVR